MQGKIEKADKVFEQIGRVCLMIAGGAIIVMVVFTFLAVLGRYVLHHEIIPGNYAICESYLMPMLIFLAFAFTYRAGVFPRLEFIVEWLSPVVQRRIQLVCLAVELVLFAAVTVYMWNYATKGVIEGLGVLAGVKLIPLYPVLFLAPFGFALLVIEVIFAIWRLAKSRSTSGAK